MNDAHVFPQVSGDLARSHQRTHSSRRQGSDEATLQRHFGFATDLLPLWMAEPSIDLAPELTEALAARASEGWFGYETRPECILDSFWDWMAVRHGWDGSGLETVVSPSVGTSIGVLIDELTDPGDGVILQPPVFTDFKTLVTSAGRTVVRNGLTLGDDGYRIDFDDLQVKSSDPQTRLLILCSPHNPVGRVWTPGELRTVATICADNDVFVLADEIHADITIPPNFFCPFAAASADVDVRWAATHGPIKTFGLAGVCDTLLVTNHAETAHRFQKRSSQLHLTRNNVFGLVAFETSYRHGGPWLDELLQLLTANIAVMGERLPESIDLVPLEGTYLAWLDLRKLHIGVSEVPNWLAAEAGIALSPGHWFGREGAGFARMTIAAPTDTIAQAAANLTRASAAR